MMLLFGGAAAVGVMREAIVQARYQSFQRAAQRAMRARLRRHSDTADPWEDSFDAEAFPCFNLCLNCGFLSDSADGNCLGCGKRAWVDLRDKQAADSIRTMERRDRREILPAIEHKGQIAGVIAGLIAGAACYFTYGHFYPGSTAQLGVTGLCTAGSVFAGYYLAPRIWNNLHFRRRPTFPARWHLPVPLPDLSQPPKTVIDGRLEPRTTELLTSPITGKPCIGYEVSVLFDEPHDKRPPMWVLEEERNIGFEMRGHYVEPDGVTMVLPPHQVSSDDWAEDSTKVGRFLRQRGLFTSEGSYAIFEALIEPDGLYQLELYDQPKDAAAVIRPR